MKHFIAKETPVTEEVLNVIAYLPTKSLPGIVEDGFFVKLSDRDIMCIAVLLAQKSYDEGGCPIGGVIIDSKTHRIVGKGTIRLCRIMTLTTTAKLQPYEMLDGRISATPRFLQLLVPAMFAPH